MLSYASYELYFFMVELSISIQRLLNNNYSGDTRFTEIFLLLNQFYWIWLNVREEEEQSLGQPCLRSVSDFIFLAMAYESRLPALSLAVSSFHWQCAVSVLIVAELARERRWSINLYPNFCPGQDLNPELHYWQFCNALTTRLLHERGAQICEEYMLFWKESKCRHHFVRQELLKRELIVAAKC